MLIRRGFFSPAQAVGIYVDAHGLTATLCDVEQPRRIRWREHQVVENLSDTVSVARFFGQVHQQVGKHYIPVSIALADPWCHQVILEFETLPPKTAECDTLIRWRLARDWQRDGEQHAISWQHLGTRDNRRWIVAQSIEHQRLTPLVQQAHQHGLMLSSVDTVSNLLLNRLKSPANTLLLNLQHDYWSLSLAGETGWPIYRRATWQTAPRAGQYEAFTAQLERMVVPLRPTRGGRLVLVSGMESDPELDEMLTKRLGSKPEVLTLPGNEQRGQTPEEQLAMQAAGNLCH